MSTTPRTQSGFTLIELMIVVAIVGILAAIAYPSYKTYVQHGYRSEGIAMMTDAAARMERYYAQNNNYQVSDMTTIGYSSASALSPTGKYRVAVTPGAMSYTITATPQAPQDTDVCKTLTLNQAGTMASSTGATNCFQ